MCMLTCGQHSGSCPCDKHTKDSLLINYYTTSIKAGTYIQNTKYLLKLLTYLQRL